MKFGFCSNASSPGTSDHVIESLVCSATPGDVLRHKGTTADPEKPMSSTLPGPGDPSMVIQGGP